MALFRARTEDEPLVVPGRTITGRPVAQPEANGGMERRARLFGSAVRVLSSDEVACEVGRPLGDGLGMEQLVDQLRPMFLKESAMLKWVALRGSLLFVDLMAPSVELWIQLGRRMGVETSVGPGGPSSRVPALEGRSQPAAGELTKNVVGLVTSIGIRWEKYDQIARLSSRQVVEGEAGFINDDIALDYIAWGAAAVLRSGRQVAETVTALPEPDALVGPGYYMDPLFMKCERFWDGQDWTWQCRVREGRKYTAFESPI